MRVLIKQLDGKMMNIALGKIARWHHDQGDSVSFTDPSPDRIYYGAIFDWTASDYRQQARLEAAEQVFGGYPFNDDHLPPEVEYLMPLYDLWKTNYSIGYTSRGCIRKCDFCIVPKKEGAIRDYQPIQAFHDPRHKKVLLLDNNFFASPRWRQNLSYIHEQKLKVSFVQGLDLRILTNEQAKLLKETKYRAWRTDHKRIFFAWDNLRDEKPIRTGLGRLRDAGIRMEDIYVYVLSGKNTTFAQDRYRAETVLWDEYRAHPFVMKYNRRTDHRGLNHLARWSNKPGLRRNHTFEEYCEHEGLSEELKKWMMEVI